MKEIAVYTVILDDYDPLRKPLHPRLKEEADFYCFTNSSITSDFFTIVPIEKKFDNASLTNRYYKILSHPLLKDYKYTIYLDGSLQIITSTLQSLIDKVLGNHDIALFKHRFRDCIYEEAKAVIYHRRADHETVYNHVKRYSQEGYPENLGLIEGGVIIRNNQSGQLKEFMQTWWQEICHHVPRDQLSFSYVKWKDPVRTAFIPGSIAENHFFKYFFHPHRPSSKTVYEKLSCRYWAIKVDLLHNKFKFGSYVDQLYDT